MKAYTACSEAIHACLAENRFAVAHLCSEEKTMNMHIHDCYEIYYSISGGKQFLIDNRCYDIEPGDVFVINTYESHYLCQVDDDAHERIVLSVSPDFLRGISSKQTDLSACFLDREREHPHRIRLGKEEQKQFLYFVYKLTSAEGYGADLVETAAFTELMIFLNRLHLDAPQEEKETALYQYNDVVNSIIAFINQKITERITLSMIASHFYLSEAYICRLFKSETGTTINKYLTARRISIAKAKLADGHSVGETCEQSGFHDYTNFVQVFTRAVGITPKKYSKFANQ